MPYVRTEPDWQPAQPLHGTAWSSVRPREHERQPVLDERGEPRRPPPRPRRRIGFAKR